MFHAYCISLRHAIESPKPSQGSLNRAVYLQKGSVQAETQLRVNKKFSIKYILSILYYNLFNIIMKEPQGLVHLLDKSLYYWSPCECNSPP
jgi:hypothetical protein